MNCLPYSPLSHIFFTSVRSPTSQNAFIRFIYICVVRDSHVFVYKKKNTLKCTYVGLYMYIKSQTTRHMDINIFNLYNFIMSVTSRLVIWTNIARWLLDSARLRLLLYLEYEYTYMLLTFLNFFAVKSVQFIYLFWHITILGCDILAVLIFVYCLARRFPAKYIFASRMCSVNGKINLITH